MITPSRLRGDKHFAELVRGGGVALLVKGAAAGLAFLLNVVIGRTFGADGAGLFYLSLAVVTVGAVVGRAGLDNAVLRFVAASAAVDDWGAIRGVFRKALIIAATGAGLVALLLFAAAPSLAAMVYAEPALATPLRLMALALLPLALLELHGQAVKGLRRIGAAEFLLGACVPLLAIGGLALIAPDTKVESAVIVYAVAALLSLVLGRWLWSLYTTPGRQVAPTFETRTLLGSSLPLWGTSLLRLVVAWAGPLLLGFWGSARDVGLFSAAARTAMATSFLLMAMNSIAAPMFAALYRQGEISALRRLLIQTTWLSGLAALPVAAALILFRAPLMGLFGEDFQAGASLLVILAMGQFVNLVTGSVGYLLMMTGHERWMQNNLLLAASVNLVLCVQLIPSHGATGAAIATAVSVALQNCVAATLAYRVLSVVPSHKRQPEHH